MELNNIEVWENLMINKHAIDRLIELDWWDALILWFRYYEQRLMQWQQLTLSTDKFMIKAMWWWVRRFTKAKKILMDLGMIDVVQKRDGDKISWWYVRVNYTFNPETVRTHSVVYEVDSEEQLEQLESSKWRFFETKILQNAGQIQPIIKEIQPNNKINTYSPKTENEICVKNEEFPEIEHPQAPVEWVDTFNFYDINDPYVQSMMKNKSFKKNNIEAFDKLIKKGYSQETIQTVLRFIKQDDFWSKQIRSLSKLLKKNPDWVMYIDVMIDKIKQWKPKVIDLDNLY